MRFATLESNGRTFVAAVSADGTQYCEASRLFPSFEGDMAALIERQPSMDGVSIKGDIETLSAGMTLRAGDVIATGTPAGVGIGFKPPRFLKPGDEMKLTIGNLGTLTNRVK